MADYLLPHLRSLLSDIEAIEYSLAMRRNAAVRDGAEDAAHWGQCHMEIWYAARQLRDIIYLRERDNESARGDVDKRDENNNEALSGK